MQHLHNVIGVTRLHFYTRVLPYCTGVITALFFALWLWAQVDGREDRASAFLVVTIFMGILTVVSVDVARMLRKLEIVVIEQQQQP